MKRKPKEKKLVDILGYNDGDEYWDLEYIDSKGTVLVTNIPLSVFKCEECSNNTMLDVDVYHYTHEGHR